MRFRYIFIFILLIGCGGGGSGDDTSYQYSQPETIGDGWETASLADVGMDETPFVRMIRNMGQPNEIHSVLVVKDGLLVFESYFRGHDYCYDCQGHHGPLVEWDMYSKHNIHSVTKTFASTLIGLAYDQGLISSLDDSMFNYFVEYSELWSPAKAEITIKDLLTMSSGLSWNESQVLYSSSNNDIVKMFRSDDPIGYILLKPSSAIPGNVFNYSGGDTNLLGQVMREVVESSLTDFANTYLFEPMEMGTVNWRMMGDNIEYVSGSMELTPREMAKLGWVYVNDGFWKNNQVLSMDWIEQATQTHIDTGRQDVGREGYGFQWWTTTLRRGGQLLDCYMAVGWGGNSIICLPELNMVVVFTGADYLYQHEIQPETLMDYIIDAVL